MESSIYENETFYSIKDSRTGIIWNKNITTAKENKKNTENNQDNSNNPN